MTSVSSNRNSYAQKHDAVKVKKRIYLGYAANFLIERNGLGPNFLSCK